MFWFISLLFPTVVFAAAVAQPSDVVLLVNGVSDDKQTNYNYLFQVEGEATYYTCQANRCSLALFREQPTVNVTFYQLPEGYQRVTSVLDQGLLAEYAQAAAHIYAVPSLETDLTDTGSNRTYHTVTLNNDNTFIKDTVSRERNAPVEEVTSAVQFSTTAALVIGGGIVVVLGLVGLAYWLWKQKF